MEDVTLVNNATLCMNVTRHDVAVWRGTICIKNYLPPSSNEKYYTTVPQHKMLSSKMLCWFTYFAANRVCRRSVFLPSIEYRINIEVECYHSYNNCYVLITRMVSLLLPYHHTHCLPDYILLTVSAL